ncbi:hypothetical protein ACFSPU_02515 [Haoranjiania flava]|uniref:hypothetical protein n=1 Tax=Haoranjiania flava TaxID=1856322 RepID=UPI0036351901
MYKDTCEITASNINKTNDRYTYLSLTRGYLKINSSTIGAKITTKKNNSQGLEIYFVNEEIGEATLK